MVSLRTIQQSFFSARSAVLVMMLIGALLPLPINSCLCASAQAMGTGTAIPASCCTTPAAENQPSATNCCGLPVLPAAHTCNKQAPQLPSPACDHCKICSGDVSDSTPLNNYPASLPANAGYKPDHPAPIVAPDWMQTPFTVATLAACIHSQPFRSAAIPPGRAVHLTLCNLRN